MSTASKAKITTVGLAIIAFATLGFTASIVESSYQATTPQASSISITGTNTDGTNESNTSTDTADTVDVKDVTVGVSSEKNHHWVHSFSSSIKGLPQR